MKKISLEQIEQVIQAFYEINAPIKNFEALKKFLLSLPDVEVKEEK